MNNFFVGEESISVKGGLRVFVEVGGGTEYKVFLLLFFDERIFLGEMFLCRYLKIFIFL